jgi:nucleoside 2-deoxyribosyltransferase
VKKQAYIAGILLTHSDRWFLEKIDIMLSSKGLSTYLPHRDAGLRPADTRLEFFFQKDITAIDDCILMISVLRGTDIDSCTAWLMGYAYAKDKLVISIAEDIKIRNQPSSINLMLSNSSDIAFSFDDLIKKVDLFLSKL